MWGGISVFAQCEKWEEGGIISLFERRPNFASAKWTWQLRGAKAQWFGFNSSRKNGEGPSEELCRGTTMTVTNYKGWAQTTKMILLT